MPSWEALIGQLFIRSSRNLLHVQTLLRDDHYGRSHSSLAVVLGLRGQEYTRSFISARKSTSAYISMRRPASRLWPLLRPLTLPELNERVLSFLKLAGRGADQNKANEGGCTALMIGSVASHVDIVRLLIDAGADINCVTRDSGLSALHFAALKNNLEVARQLVEAGADKSIQSTAGSGRPRFTALDLAVTNGHTEIIELLS